MRKVDISKDVLIELYVDQNLTLDQCAERLSVSKDVIRNRVKEYGITKPVKSQVVDRDMLHKLYIEENLSLAQCAAQLKVSEFIIWRELKRCSIVKDMSAITAQRVESRRRNVVAGVKTSKLSPPTEDLLQRISKKDLYDFYVVQDNSIKVCAARFDTRMEKIRSLLKHYNIRKEYTYGARSRQKKEDRVARLNELAVLVPEERLRDLYIDQDLTFPECGKELGISVHYVRRLAERYNIKKSPAQLVQNQNKQRERTALEKYGVACTASVPEFRAKRAQTCLEKYGVPYACQTPQCKEAGSGCHSGPNEGFCKLLEEAGLSFEREPGLGRKNYNYDFRVGNTLIEIDPWYTHNSTLPTHWKDDAKPIDYHFNKSQFARENGCRCIHIWDWDKPEKVIYLLESRDTVYARSCDVRDVDNVEAQKFLDLYHTQGSVRGSILNLGLYYNDELISLMTFGKPRYTKRYQYELLRYCSIKNVAGGAERLFKHFVERCSPSSIVSYCDMAKFDGTTYDKLGFTLVNTSIGKHWYNPKTKKHITDNLLRQRGFDQLLGKEYGTYGKGTSNEQLMLEHGFVEIYDAGQATYVKEFI